MTYCTQSPTIQCTLLIQKVNCLHLHLYHFVHLVKIWRFWEQELRVSSFNDPVCNSFVPTVHYNQLCYKIDLEKFRNNKEIENQLKYGLDIILDYNENRQLTSEQKQMKNDELKRKPMFHSEKQEGVSIHFDTLSNKYFFLIIFNKF